MKYRISADNIDAYLYDIQKYLWKRHGVDETDRMIDPLLWYITTGRASAQWIHKLMSVKPFVIARILEKDYSYGETIMAVKERVAKA